jgi:hypothetical protein
MRRLRRSRLDRERVQQTSVPEYNSIFNYHICISILNTFSIRKYVIRHLLFCLQDVAVTVVRERAGTNGDDEKQPKTAIEAY